MKTFKKTDIWVSIILILITAISALFYEMWIYGYFIVGAWQTFSMALHYTNHWFVEKGSDRNNYHWTVLAIFLLAVSAIFFTVILFGLMLIMLFAAPFLAIYYTWLCYQEVYIKMQRPLSLLK